MTFRAHFILCLTLSMASACVVAGEDDPALEELESGTASRTDPEDIALYRSAKRVSYSSFTSLEREGLHATLDAFDAESTRYEGILPECTFDTWGWACSNSWVECGCQYAPSGWKCECGEPFQ